MSNKPFPRDLIHVVLGDARDRGCREGLAIAGWRMIHVQGVDEVVAHLQEGGDSSHVAVLDLSGGAGKARETAQQAQDLMRACMGARVGWIAAVGPDQLQAEWVRKVITDYCHDYVTLPWDPESLEVVLGHVHGMAALMPGQGGFPVETGPDEMVGASPPMQALFRNLRKAALSDAPTYISGETGTGKELVATALHGRSSRHGKPFVAINCGAIPRDLVQSELFGYERGAFTGAVRRKPGKIEQAHGGTLFLDEIGDLPMDSQASLLRFLQECCIERLGGEELIPVDVRVVSASHVDLAAAVGNGSFREDLFHRLRVIELQLPPLRDRGSDIERLASHALHRYAEDGGRRRIRGFTPCALRAMRCHRWSGNVRELLNRVRQAMVMADGAWITARDLRLLEPDNGQSPQTLETARGESERAAIEHALKRNGHRLVATARDLGISRVTLYRLMTRHGLRGQDDGSAATHID